MNAQVAAGIAAVVTATEKLSVEPMTVAPEPSSEGGPENDQTVAEAIQAVDAKKDDMAAETVLTPFLQGVYGASSSPVKLAITAVAEAGKGATRALFGVLRAVTSAGDAEVVLLKIETDWSGEHDLAPIPAAWRTAKSKMLTTYKALPGILVDAEKAANVNMQKASILGEAERAEHLKALRLDKPERMLPASFEPDQHALWQVAVSGLRTAIAKAKTPEQKASEKHSGATGSGLQSGAPENGTTGLPDEVITVRQRWLRAVFNGNGIVPQQELVAMILRQAEEIEKRIVSARNRGNQLNVAPGTSSGKNQQQNQRRA